MVIMAPVEMRIQTLNERHLAAATGDEIVHIVYDVERVCPFIACAKKKKIRSVLHFCIAIYASAEHQRTLSPPIIRPRPASIRVPGLHEPGLVVEEVERCGHGPIEKELGDRVRLPKLAREDIGCIVVV
jgi:hypothetical protein